MEPGSAVEIEDYQHVPLPGEHYIRILTVRPAASPSAPFACEIGAYAHDQHVPYTALSYSWAMQDGDGSFCREIFVRGKRMPITRNLYEALRRIRHATEDLHIWIDAVCINQHDNAEKTAQVANMAAVYRDATQVIAWLGEGEPIQDLLIFSLFEAFRSRTVVPVWDFGQRRYLQCDRPVSATESPVWTYGRRINPRHLLSSAIHRIRRQSTWSHADTVALIKSFILRRYFSRRWIVQEVAHARAFKIQWAQFTLTDLKVLEETVQTMYRIVGFNSALDIHVGHKLHNFASLTSLLAHGWSQSPEGPTSRSDTIIGLHFACNHLQMQCSDPRDKLYSLIGLAPVCGIFADYSRDVSYASVKFSVLLWTRGMIYHICACLDRSWNSDYDEVAHKELPSWAISLNDDPSFHEDVPPVDLAKLRPEIEELSVLSCQLKLLCTLHQVDYHKIGARQRHEPLLGHQHIFECQMKGAISQADIAQKVYVGTYGNGVATPRQDDLICLPPELHGGVYNTFGYNAGVCAFVLRRATSELNRPEGETYKIVNAIRSLDLMTQKDIKAWQRGSRGTFLHFPDLDTLPEIRVRII